MIGPTPESRFSPTPNAAAIRLVIAPRLERQIEQAGEGPADRSCNDRCPPAERVLPSPGETPFDRFLEKRNREDTVEFSLGRAPHPVENNVAMHRPERLPTPDRPAGVRGRDEGDRSRWPRLGDVPPVVAEALSRRLETVYRVTVPVRGGRIDLVG